MNPLRRPRVGLERCHPYTDETTGVQEEEEGVHEVQGQKKAGIPKNAGLRYVWKAVIEARVKISGDFPKFPKSLERAGRPLLESVPASRVLAQ
jgi:hypothetical protein